MRIVGNSLKYKSLSRPLRQNIFQIPVSISLTGILILGDLPGNAAITPEIFILAAVFSFVQPMAIGTPLTIIITGAITFVICCISDNDSVKFEVVHPRLSR